MEVATFSLFLCICTCVCVCVCVCSLDELFSIIFGVLIIRNLAPSPFSSELAVYIVHLFLDIHDSNEYRLRLSLSIGQNCLERIEHPTRQLDSMFLQISHKESSILLLQVHTYLCSVS